MSSSSDGQIRGLDYNGFKRGRVVNNVDPMGEGRLAIFVPSLVTEVPNNLEEPSPTATQVKSSLFVNGAELNIKTQTKKDNFLWFRPAGALMENGAKSANASGNWRIPKPGTVVTVYFENGDPNKPYWLPQTPTIKGDIIAGSGIGKSPGTTNSTGNWKDNAKKVNIEVLSESDSGAIVYLDNNPNANTFVVHMANGHTISIYDNDTSGLILKSSKGAFVEIDDTNEKITARTVAGAVMELDDSASTASLKTQSGAASLVLNDNGNINLIGSGIVTIDGAVINIG